MRRIPIRLKLAAALLGPLVLLLAVTTYEVGRSTGEARATRAQVALAEASVGPSGLFNSLQDERNRAAVDVMGLGDAIGLAVATNAEARTLTDRSLAEFTRVVADGSDTVQDSYAPAFEQLATLDALRADIDAFDLPASPAAITMADEVFSRYSTIVDELLDANARLVVAIDDPDLRRGADLSYLASAQADVVARLIRHVLVTATTPAGFNDREALVEMGRLYGRAVTGEATIQALATGEYAAIAQPIHDASPPFYAAVAETFDTGRLSPDFVTSIDTEPHESYDGPFRDQVKALLDRTAAELQDDADRRAWRYRVFALLIVAIAALATYWVSRSITRPLRTLTIRATDMAQHRLPAAVRDVLDTPLGDDVAVPALDPVRMRTRDEVADVADALTTVQDSALDLAVGQAVLRRNIADSFLNLGRRNQNLLGRQIDFITQLENDATDPDVLANLFRLDHLATRMRRNAESLLVLAGIDPPRRWQAPVRVTEVIRAALGEVEDFQRVTVRDIEVVAVMGSTAADLAHLLAEIIENALVFSPPDQAVEIGGRLHPQGYTLAVVDHGVGMSAAELERANRRLAGAESFTIAPSKYLGHYVAGHLAARHGIRLVLHGSSLNGSGSGRGVTATVHLPPGSLETASAAIVEEL